MTGPRNALLAALGRPLFVALVLVHVASLVYTARVRVEVTDFTRDYLGGRARLAGRSMYTPFRPDAVTAEALGTATGLDFSDREPATIHLAHPPTLLLFYLPVAWLPYDWAYVAWGVAALAGYAWLVLAALRATGGEAGRGPERWFWAAVFLAWVPFCDQMFEGQTSLLVALLVYGAWAADRSGRPAAAGACVAVAGLLKLFPLLLLGYFALRGRVVALASACLVYAAGAGVAVAVFGPAEAVRYATEVAPAESKACSVNPYNVSLWSVFYRVFADNARFVDRPLFAPAVDLGAGAGLLAAAACGAVLVAFLALCRRAPRDEGGDDRAFAAGVVASLLLSPLTWQHYLLAAAVPLLVLWRRCGPRGRRDVLALLVLFNVPSRVVARWLIEGYPGLVPASVSWVLFYLTAGLLYLLVRLAAPPEPAA